MVGWAYLKSKGWLIYCLLIPKKDKAKHQKAKRLHPWFNGIGNGGFLHFIVAAHFIYAKTLYCRASRQIVNVKYRFALRKETVFLLKRAVEPMKPEIELLKFFSTPKHGGYNITRRKFAASIIKFCNGGITHYAWKISCLVAQRERRNIFIRGNNMNSADDCYTS
jgi:hypothetical protein